MLCSAHYVKKPLLCWLRRLAIMLTLPRTVVSTCTTYCNIRTRTRYSRSSYGPHTEIVYLPKEHFRVCIWSGGAVRMEVKCSVLFLFEIQSVNWIKRQECFGYLMSIIVQQDATMYILLYFSKLLYISSFIDTNLIHNFYINYIKLSSSTCFKRHPLIFRRSMMLIVHVCSLWYSHSLQVAVLCTCQRETV